jgi:hypothetical protein
MGLLHVAFDMEASDQGESIERFRFLLEVADGFEAYDEFRKPDDSPGFGCTYGTLMPTGIIHEPRQMRRTVAAKAMQVLCDRAFRFEPAKGFQMAWLFVLPEVFEKLTWFLDDGDRRTHAYNLSDLDHGRFTTAVREFACRFIGSAWEFMPDRFGRFNRQEEMQIRTMFAAARPRFVSMLFRMNRLGMLIDIDKRWSDMGEPEMAVLRAAARRRSMGNEVYGEYLSRDEALYEGSRAAQVLIAIEACQRQLERKRRLADAEQKLHEAEAEIKETRQ